MKVCIPLRVDAYEKYGGDVLHAEKIADGLVKRGVDVHITTSLKPELSRVDIVHLFNMDWVRDPILQARYSKKNGVPVVLTPIHHSFSEIDYFEKKERYGFRRLTNIFLKSYYQREMAKNIYRAFVDVDLKKWRSTLSLIGHGLRSEYKELLSLCSLVMPNTELEEEEIRSEFNLEINSQVVPAGVDISFEDSSPKWFMDNYVSKYPQLKDDFLLMVGRIEPRKNQLRVINSLEEVDFPIVLVGKYNPHHPEYTFRVRGKIKGSNNIVHIEEIKHENIGSVFAACRVHVLASWFETTGLVNLEAALAGANVVSSTRGFGKEYLGNNAILVNPEDKLSIKEGVLKAMNSKVSSDLIRNIKENYSWDKVVDLTLDCYKKVLDN